MGESPGKMYAMAVILTMLATIAVGLRHYARYLKKAGCSWDEHMILLALIFTFANAISIIVGAADGDLGRHTLVDPERDWPIPTHRTTILMQIIYATEITATIAIGFTKLAVLLFYKRIFQGKLINVAVWTNIVIVSVWTVAFFLSNVFQCWPISENWISDNSSYGSCINGAQMLLGQAYSDVVTDVLILALPIPCVWAMTMPARHKLAVSGIFLLGLLTVGTGIAKIVVFNRANYLLATGTDSDISIVMTPTVYWPFIECTIGIIGACLPLFRPLFSSGSGSKGFGQVRNLRSVRLPSSAGNETPELKPWGSMSGSSAEGAKPASEVSISRIVPGAIEPWEERQVRRERAADERV